MNVARLTGQKSNDPTEASLAGVVPTQRVVEAPGNGCRSASPSTGKVASQVVPGSRALVRTDCEAPLVYPASFGVATPASRIDDYKARVQSRLVPSIFRTLLRSVAVITGTARLALIWETKAEVSVLDRSVESLSLALKFPDLVPVNSLLG